MKNKALQTTVASPTTPSPRTIKKALELSPQITSINNTFNETANSLKQVMTVSTNDPANISAEVDRFLHYATQKSNQRKRIYMDMFMSESETRRAKNEHIGTRQVSQFLLHLDPVANQTEKVRGSIKIELQVGGKKAELVVRGVRAHQAQQAAEFITMVKL